VLERAGNICEGCGEKKASQVHHLTYKHLRLEFLFELVAVCEKCHDTLHDEDINGD
jgi:5-methylcytosine-specific restriction endonuclease McrA